MSETPRTSKKHLKTESKRPIITPTAQPSSRKYHRKSANPVRFINAESSMDNGNPNVQMCKNSACRANMSMDDIFCKRCSCCICKLFDENKDPSLWLVCDSEYGVDACGLSCHIECALRNGRLGVIGFGEAVNLDGRYGCASCGKVSSILGFWKKQLTIAKEARRVDVLCERILLSYRLLEGTFEFRALHKIVQEIKAMLEREIGPVSEVAGKTSRRGLVSRLPIAGEIQNLCDLAIRKADDLLAVFLIINMKSKEIPASGDVDPSDAKLFTKPANKNPNINNKSPKDQCPRSSPKLDLNVAFDLNEEISPSLNNYMDEDCYVIKPDYDSVPGGKKKMSKKSYSGFLTNGEMPAVNSREEIPRKRDVTTIDTNESGVLKKSGNSDFNFDHCVKVVCKIECDGHISEEFRKKFLTWFSLKSTEHEKRVVKTFIQCIDDLSSLADQLIDTFSEKVNFKKPRNSP